MRRISWALVLVPVTAFAQRPSATWSSYQKARVVVDSAVAAMGGAEALFQLSDVSRELHGVRTDVGQGPKPAKVVPTYTGLGEIPPTINRPWITSVRDYTNGRAIDHLRDTIYGGQLIEWNVIVAPPAVTRVYYDYIKDGTRTGSPASLPLARASAMRKYPEGLLRAMLNRADALRFLGESTSDGQPQKVVAFADADGAQLSAYFDAKTHQLTKVETIGDDAILGDISNETYFLDYRRVGSLRLPYRYVDKYGGYVQQDMRASAITVDTRPSDSLFMKPAGFAEVAAAVGGPQLEKLSNDAIAVFGSDYNSIAFAFADYIMVIEAGANARYAAAALAQIKQTFPNKPVRYLVSTHWNWDHLGGVRPYVAEGATIVTTPHTQSQIERAVKAPHTMRPDALSRQPRAAKFELVTTPKRVFTDGTRVVEIYNISPNPHVDEMLIAYLPNENVLYEADMFDLPVAGHGGTGGDDTAALLRTIESLGLDVQKIIPTHGVAATMTDLRDAVARRTRAANK